MMRRLLITGTGRCGTGYVAETLRRAGIRCGHESIYNCHTTGQWDNWEASCSWLSAPHTQTEHNNGTYIVLLTRDPWKVAMSWERLGMFRNASTYRTYIETHLPTILNFTDPREQALHFALHWCDQVVAHETIDITRLDAEHLARWTGLDTTTLRNILNQMPTNYNHNPGHYPISHSDPRVNNV